MDTFGTRLRNGREAAGMTQLDVIVQARSDLPKSMWISQTKLQRLESGKVDEESVDPFLVSYLAAAYDMKLSELSPVAAESLAREKVKALVNIAWTLALGISAEPNAIGAQAA